MSDLISRKALIKRFTFNSDGKRIHEHDVDNFSVTVPISTVKSMIREMPTAFDVDKFIAELEKLSIEELGVSESQFEMDKGEYSSYCTLCLYDVAELLKKHLSGTAEPPKTD